MLKKLSFGFSAKNIFLKDLTQLVKSFNKGEHFVSADFELPHQFDPTYKGNPKLEINLSAPWAFFLSIIKPAKKMLLVALILEIGYAVASIAAIFVMKKLLEFVQNPHLKPAGLVETVFASLGLQSFVFGIALSFALVAFNLITVVFRSNSSSTNGSAMNIFEINLIPRTFNHVLNLSPHAFREHTIGDLFEKIRNDAFAISRSLAWFSDLVATPIKIVGFLVALFVMLGPLSGLVAVLGTSVVLLLTQKLARKLEHLSHNLSERRADRVSLLTLAISIIRVVKAFTWEDSFQIKIQKLRMLETKELRKIVNIETIMNVLSISSRVLVCLTTFATFIATGNALTPAIVFTTLVVLKQLENELVTVENTVLIIAPTRASVLRVYNLFLEPQAKKLDTRDTIAAENAIVFENFDAKYHESNDLVLKNINLKIKNGESVAVIGAVAMLLS